MKLLILDFVNYFLSLLSESDRKALIGDLSEQQRVLDAADEEKKTIISKRTLNNNKTVSDYMEKKDDLEFRTL